MNEEQIKEQLEKHFGVISGYMTNCSIRLSNPNGSIYDKKATLSVTIEEIKRIRALTEELFGTLRALGGK